MTDVAELKQLAKNLQSASTSETIIDILKILKKDVKVTEASLRESRAGLAVGKLRTHATKEVADLAKELVKKWKHEVEKEKQGHGSVAKDVAHKPAPLRKASIADSVKSPTTPTGGAKGGATRSAKTDGVIINVSGDKTRDKCIELIYDSLATDSDSPSDQILKKATAIEASVLSDHSHDTGKDYKAKIRSLYLNLKDRNNPGLRENIMSGSLAITRFTKMSSQEMASEERKAADEAIQAENLHKSLGAAEQQAETDAFQCGKCKQRKTRYRQAQTRSADEPMTTFVTCVVCNHRWKFS